MTSISTHDESGDCAAAESWTSRLRPESLRAIGRVTWWQRLGLWNSVGLGVSFALAALYSYFFVVTIYELANYDELLSRQVPPVLRGWAFDMRIRLSVKAAGGAALSVISLVLFLGQKTRWAVVVLANAFGPIMMSVFEEQTTQTWTSLVNLFPFDLR